MKVSNKGWDQCANAQAAVDSHKQIIVACDVTNQTNDKQQFEPMLEKAQRNIGEDKRIKAVSSDSGYYSQSNVEYSQEKRIDAYIATEKVQYNAPVAAAPRGRIIRKARSSATGTCFAYEFLLRMFDTIYELKAIVFSTDQKDY